MYCWGWEAILRENWNQELIFLMQSNLTAVFNVCTEKRPRGKHRQFNIGMRVDPYKKSDTKFRSHKKHYG